MKYVGLLTVFVLMLTLQSCEQPQSQLEITSLEYQKNYDIEELGREVDFTLIIKNSGPLNCLIMNAYSLEFWNADEPGVASRYSEKLVEPVPAGEATILHLHPFLKNVDIRSSGEKEFEIRLRTTEGCVLENETIRGTIHIIV